MATRVLAAIALAVALIAPAGTGFAQPVEAAAINPKVVIIAGPAGSANAHYRADADALTAAARKYTSNVVEIKTPKATWAAVTTAAQGAAILVYLGHGNGWPSRYRDALWPYTQNGFGLDPDTGADGVAHVYYGEAQIASDIRLAPNAVVLLFHLCYASGNTEPGLATGTLADKKARVDNFAAGFFAAGARAVIADAYAPHVPYITALFTSASTVDAIFRASTTYHGHPIAWASTRMNGPRDVMDPTDPVSGPWYHSIVYTPGMTAPMVTRTRYAPTDTVPPSLVVGGAGLAVAATTRYADAALATQLDVLPAGQRLRILAEAPALADGTRVVQVRPLDGDVTGYVRATDLAPADSTPARLYTYDPPGAIVSPNGDFVHDTFRVVVRASEPLDGTVVVRNAAGTVVDTLTASDAWSIFDWDLTLPDGGLVPDGRYTWSYAGREPWGNNPGPFTASGTFILDATDPVTSASKAGPFDPSGWYTGPATVSLSATDALTGVAGTRYQVDGGTIRTYAGPFAISTTGNHQVAYWSIDKAGNVEGAHTLAVPIDVSAPVTTANLAGPVGQAGFYRDDVTASLDASDPQSGVAATLVSVDGAALAPYVGPFTIGAEGVHHLAFRSTDRLGHVEALRKVDLTIDRTAPALGPDGSVAPSAAQLSPNGDRIADTVSVSHRITEPGLVRLTVTEGASGADVRTLDVPVAAASPGAVTWDGRNDAGAIVPDGDYRLTLTPFDRARNQGPSASVDVAVFGAFVGLAVSPARFFPQDGDKLAPRTAIVFTLRAPAEVQVRVVNATGVTLRTMSGTYPAGPATVAWDGRGDSGAFVPQGRYRLVATATVGGRSETHAAYVQAAAFELRPSVTSVRRGARMTLTAVTSESLRTAPRLTVRQPGRAAYSLAMTRVASGVYRVTWTVRTGGRAGTMTLSVAAIDRMGGRNATAIPVRVR